MEIARFLSRQPRRLLGLVWRPAQKVAQSVCRVLKIAEYMAQQVRDILKQVSRTLDGAVPQPTRVRARSQMEWVFGPMTFSVTSRVLFARPGGEVRYSAPPRRNLR